MAFLFAEANVLYSAALLLVLALFAIELLGLLSGFSLLAMLDDFSPIDVDADIEAQGPAQLLSWLCLDRLPLMVWLVVWLTCFACVGLSWTSVFSSLLPFSVPFLLHTLISLVLASVLTGIVGRFIARLIPKHQSSAVHLDGLAGSTGEITLGTANPGSPAEAKVLDAFQQIHYLMVEPIEQDSFHQGDTVILVKKGPRGWLAMRYQ